MSREEKIRLCRELRAQGFTAREIAERVDAPESTVRNWYLGGVCRCGALLDGSSGANSSTVCRICAAEDRTIWPREAIVAAIREWVARYGQTPAAYEWDPAIYKAKGGMNPEVRRRYRQHNWPATNTVINHFGSWNAGMEAAGFVPRGSSKRGPDRWVIGKRQRRSAAA